MKTNTPVFIIGFMIIMSVLFGGAITGIYLSQAERLEENEMLLLQKSLAQVFNLVDIRTASNQKIEEAVNQRVTEDTVVTDPETDHEFTLLKAYKSEKHKDLIAYGFRFRGQGFWAPIEGIIALSPDLKTTSGIVIVEQAETPGLGGRVAEKEFTEQFRKGLKVSPPEEGSAWLKVIASIPEDAKPPHRYVHAMTGATQTSNAMEVILNEHLTRFHRAMKNATLADNES